MDKSYKLFFLKHISCNCFESSQVKSCWRGGLLCRNQHCQQKCLSTQRTDDCTGGTVHFRIKFLTFQGYPYYHVQAVLQVALINSANMYTCCIDYFRRILIFNMCCKISIIIYIIHFHKLYLCKKFHPIEKIIWLLVFIQDQCHLLLKKNKSQEITNIEHYFF